jgi:hypothetical protein
VEIAGQKSLDDSSFFILSSETTEMLGIRSLWFMETRDALSPLPYIDARRSV